MNFGHKVISINRQGFHKHTDPKREATLLQEEAQLPLKEEIKNIEIL